MIYESNPNQRRFAISKDSQNSRPPKKERDKDSLRVNREIRAPEIRVIDEEGAMLGIFSVPEGIRLAEEKGLDLIEIAPTAKPPTCKIMDYGKWKYENKKKAALARKNQVTVDIKEIQLRPRTDQHDLETKLRHARRFLLDGDKVKVSLRFMGRELAHQEVGIEVMQKVISTLNDISMIESHPKLEGKQMFLLLAPDQIKIKDYKKLHPDKDDDKDGDRLDSDHEKESEKSESKGHGVESI